MVKMPSSPEQQLGGLPNINTNRPVATADLTGIGRGVANAGAAVADAAASVQARWDELDKTKFETDWARFQYDRAKEFDGLTQQLTPEDARGFTGRYLGQDGDFQKARAAFLENAPSSLKDEARTRLTRLEATYFGEGLKTERAQQSVFANRQYDDALNNVYLPQAQSAAQLPANDPQKRLQLNSAIADAYAQIDGIVGWNDAQKEEARRQARASLQSAFASSLPAAERVLVDPVSTNQTFVERVAEVESSGNPNAENPDSSAVGTHQFLKGTWLGLIRAHRPDLAEGKNDAQILAMRTDPALSADMAEVYAAENASALRAKGLSATQGNLYLAHFLGPGGAAAMLKADPSALAAEVNPTAAKANPNVFTEGATAGDIVAWANEKMGVGAVAADWGRELDAIPYDQKLAIAQDGAAALVKARTAMEEADQERYQTWRDDFRAKVEQGEYGHAEWQQALDEGIWRGADATTFRNLIEERTRKSINLANAGSWLSNVLNTGEKPDTFDADNRKRVDLLYEEGSEGGEALISTDPQEANAAAQTLQRLVGATGIMPTQAVSSLRTGIRSNDPTVMMRSFEILDTLYNNDSTRSGVEQFFGADIERLFDYRSAKSLFPADQLAEQMAGMDKATQEIRQERMSAARREVEDLTAADIADMYSPRFLGSPFLASLLPGRQRPQAPIMPDDQIRFTKDYREAYSRIAAWGVNPDKAQEEALRQVSQKWGPSRVGSEYRMMRYPPDNPNQYPQVDGSYDYQSEQVEALLRSQHPELFERRVNLAQRQGIQDPIPRSARWFLVATAETERDIATNRRGGPQTPPRYQVAYYDNDGVLNLLTGAESAKPVSISFDYRGAQERSRAEFEAEREAIGAPPEIDETMYQGQDFNLGARLPGAPSPPAP